MPFHVPQQETLSRADIERLQQQRLAALFEQVLADNAFYRRLYDTYEIDPRQAPFDKLPLVSRSEIEQDQLDHPPFGTVHTFPTSQYVRMHQTSGSSGSPLRCLDTADSWRWWIHCWSIVYRAAGVQADDRLVFPFSFGPFIGFWSAFEAAALGNLCLPAGGMTTPARIRYILENQATVVCCTPTYALRMAEAARQDGIDLATSPVRLLIVAGEPGGSIPAVRSRIESAWGARVIDHVGMTEIGAWGFECVEAPGGVHVIESEFIAEVINPETGELVPDGEMGELILTNLGRVGLPMIRYRTGDQIALTRNQCACGRWFARAEGGVRGRIDDMLLIRGNNVFPATIEAIMREFDEVAEFRLIVEDAASLADLRIEVEPSVEPSPKGLERRIAAAIRDRLHFRPVVTIVSQGSLPRFDLKARRLVRAPKSRD